MELTDWKDIFIKLTKEFTIDEAALVAASINPFCVNSSISDAMNGGFEGWPTAKMVARLLTDAVVIGELDVKEASFYTHKGYFEIIDGRTLREYITANPSYRLDSATFRGKSVWRWMACRSLIDRKYDEEYSSSIERLKELMRTSRNSKNVEADGSEQIKNLTHKIAELTERLQQAEEEIASLKIKAPTFRHMTPLLELVSEVQERYWGDNWDRNDDDTKPKQKDIIEWVAADRRCPRNEEGKGSANQAKMVAVVAKPIS